MKNNSAKGFSLIELLIVISVFGILAGFLLSNLSDARMRARDSRAKSELNSIKQALSLYLNVYNLYPASDSSNSLYGCGVDGTDSCPVCDSADFAAGGADGCNNIFMSKITQESTGKFFFNYSSCTSGESYRLTYQLENKSDPEISESQARCPASTCGLIYTDTDYVVCP